MEEGARMDETTYARWWQFHLRVARGENLDAAEQAAYDEGLAALDLEEQSQLRDTDLARLRQLKAEVERLETDHARLESMSHRLDRQIWTLEGAYMVLTGLELGSEGSRRLH
jgi:hypothetical protein